MKCMTMMEWKCYPTVWAVYLGEMKIVSIHGQHNRREKNGWPQLIIHLLKPFMGHPGSDPGRKVEVMDESISTWVGKHNGLLEVLFTLMSDQSWEWVTFQVGGLRNNISAVTKAFHTLMIKRNRLVRYEMLIAKLSRGSSSSPAPVVPLEGPRLVMESTSPKRASVSLCFLLYSRWPRKRKQRYWVKCPFSIKLHFDAKFQAGKILLEY